MEIKELTFTRFTPELIKATRAEWLQQAEKSDMPTLGYEQRLEWAEQHCDYDSAGSTELAYAICNPAGGVLAMVEVVYTKRAGPALAWLKMLEVKVGPQLAPAMVEANLEVAVLLSQVYAAAIIETVKLTSTHVARVVKLYGRDATMMTLLSGIKEKLSSDDRLDAYSVSFEGRWLVISTVA